MGIPEGPAQPLVLEDDCSSGIDAPVWTHPTLGLSAEFYTFKVRNGRVSEWGTLQPYNGPLLHARLMPGPHVVQVLDTAVPPEELSHDDNNDEIMEEAERAMAVSGLQVIGGAMLIWILYVLLWGRHECAADQCQRRPRSFTR